MLKMPWQRGSRLKMANSRLRALIIGAGNIAAGYDQPDSAEILTHAHGFASVPDFELIGFIDADIEKAKVAAQKWGGQVFVNIADAFAGGPIDVVSVATPDATHAAILQELAGFAPRVIFCEKPLATSLTDAEKITALYRSLPTQIQVNYLRRFVPAFQEIRDAIAAGLFGKYLTGSGIYVKGFLHNGSHMVDLLRFWLGDIVETGRLGPISLDSEGDPEMSARLQFKDGGCFLVQSLAGNPYWMFEMDLFFEKRRLRVLNSGFLFEEYEPHASELFPGTVELTGNLRSPLNWGSPCSMPFKISEIICCRGNRFCVHCRRLWRP